MTSWRFWHFDRRQKSHPLENRDFPLSLEITAINISAMRDGGGRSPGFCHYTKGSAVKQTGVRPSALCLRCSSHQRPGSATVPVELDPASAPGLPPSTATVYNEIVSSCIPCDGEWRYKQAFAGNTRQKTGCSRLALGPARSAGLKEKNDRQWRQSDHTAIIPGGIESLARDIVHRL